MKRKVSGFVLFMLILCGCSNNQSDVIIEYGDKVKLEDYFALGKGETISSKVTIDPKVIGIYDVKATITESNQNKREESKKITVKDMNKAEIQLMQSTKQTYEIPFQAIYNPIGNIDKIIDQIDGEYKEIDIVSKEQYDQELEKIKDFRKKAQKQVFTSNEQIKEYKKNIIRAGYTLMTGDINTDIPGNYKISISVIDKSYNVTEANYNVKVLEEGKGVNKDKIAAGVEGTKMGGAIAYKINNKKEQKKKDLNEKASTAKESAQPQDSTESSNIAKDTIDAQGSSVLQAALNYVGTNMSCDELATMALVNGGYLKGTPEKIFCQGNYYNIGVYQMPAIGTYISEREAVPGDLILYDDGGVGCMHVAVYAGKGKAVHGGFNGNQVVINSAYIGTGPKYFRVSPMTWSDVSMKVYGHATDENGYVIWPNLNSQDITEPSTNNSEIIDRNDFNGNANGNTYIEYTFTINIEQTSITLKSSTPIDENYISEHITKYAEGKITMEEMKANFESKGYIVVE